MRSTDPWKSCSQKTEFKSNLQYYSFPHLLALSEIKWTGLQGSKLDFRFLNIRYTDIWALVRLIDRVYRVIVLCHCLCFICTQDSNYWYSVEYSGMLTLRKYTSEALVNKQEQDWYGNWFQHVIRNNFCQTREQDNKSGSGWKGRLPKREQLLSALHWMLLVSKYRGAQWRRSPQSWETRLQGLFFVWLYCQFRLLATRMKNQKQESKILNVF